jgi:hypothetical protein
MKHMSSKAWSRRLSQLIDQVEGHPHKAEIIRLAEAQLADDFERTQPTHLHR